MVEVGREAFEELVAEALDGIPEEIGRQMRNVAVLVEDDPPPGEALFGRYEGVPLTERAEYFGALPDRITIYRRPLCAACRSEAELVRQVRITVVHEVAHHFGIDDDRLDELGYG
jgi:predicted Zn-dependent protease with MMP-like domain